MSEDRTEKKVQASAVTNRPRFEGGTSYVTGDSNSKAILRGLARFEPALAELTDKIGREQHAAKAMQDFKEGREPSNTANNYMVVYGRLQGEKKAIEFQNELNTWREQNPNAEFGAYEQTKATMLNKYTEGLKSYSLATFLPNAIRHIGSSDTKFQNRQNEIITDDTYNSISAVVRGKYADLIKADPENKSKNLRAMLSQMQADYKGGPLKTKQISASFVGTMIQEAERNGDASLLDFADEKDANGIAIMDTELSEAVRQGRNRAKAAAKENKELQDEQRKALTVQRHNEMAFRMSDAAMNGNLQAIREELKALRTYVNPDNNAEGLQFSIAQINQLEETGQKLLARGSFPEYTNQEILRDLTSKGILLQREDVNAVSDTMAYADYERLMRQVVTNEKATQTAEGKQFKADYNSILKSGSSEVNRKTTLGRLFYTNGHLRERMLRQEFNKLIDDEMKSSGNDFLSEPELNKIMQKSIANIDKDFPVVHNPDIPQFAGANVDKNYSQKKSAAQAKLDARRRKKQAEEDRKNAKLEKE